MASGDEPLQTSVAAGRGFEASVVTVEREIESLVAEWDALADRTSATPFQRPGWVAAWWRAFGKGTLEILTVKRGGQLVGVLPLYHRHGTLISTSNWHVPTFGSVADDSDVPQTLARTVFSRAPRHANLAFVDPGGPDLDAWRSAAEAAGYRALVRTLERSPYVELDSDWETYRARLNRRSLRDLERNLRRLEREGRVRLEISEGGERLDALLAEGFRLEAAAWKAARRTAITSHAETLRFYGAVARWAAQRGSLRLVFLKVGGHPIAFHYALEEGGVYYPLKGGYDPAFRRVSPGSIIIHLTLERAFCAGLTRYELLAGTEPYKLRWTTSCRDLVLFQAFAPTIPGLLDRALYAYVRPLAKRAHLGPLVASVRR